VLRAELAEITVAASSREQGLARYGEMLAAIGAEAFEAPLLDALRAQGAEATREMARLGRILSFLDARNNEVFRIFIAPVLPCDRHGAIALEAWRGGAGRHVRAWLDALAEVEALASLGGFAFERPDHAYPELEDEPRFSARALAHPLIAKEKRVANDVTI